MKAFKREKSHRGSRYRWLSIRARYCLLGLLVIGFLWGCADPDQRVDRPTFGDDDGREAKAQAAFLKAQAAIDLTGIGIDLSELSDLGNLESILASPAQLEALPETAIQDAIGAMYSVLDASGEQIPSAEGLALLASPARATGSTDSILSETDQILMHINLAYFYISDAVRLLQTEKGDLFEVGFEDGQYDFHLTPAAEQKFKNLQSEEYIRQFSAEQRQAVIDAVVLLTSAKIKVLEQPGVKDINDKLIQDQVLSIDRKVSRQDALFHLDRGLQMATELAPDLAKSINELNKNVADVFTEKMLDKVTEWGFTITNKEEVGERIKKLISGTSSQ